jgi:hypothetical protein
MHFVYDSCDGNTKTAMRKYQYLNSDPMHTNRCVSTTVNCSLRNTGAYMSPVHTGHGRCNKQNEVVRLVALYGNPSARTHNATYWTSLFQSLEYTAWWTVVSFSCTTYTRATADTASTFSPRSLASTQNCMNLTFCTMHCGLMRQHYIYMVWNKQSPQHTCMATKESTCYLTLFIWRKI